MGMTEAMEFYKAQFQKLIDAYREQHNGEWPPLDEIYNWHVPKHPADRKRDYMQALLCKICYRPLKFRGSGGLWACSNQNCAQFIEPFNPDRLPR